MTLENFLVKISIGLTLLLFATPSAAKASRCTQKLEGTWQFGRAPYGCGIEKSLARDYSRKYGSLIFDEGKPRAKETQRFIREMHDFLSYYARNYYLRRDPHADEAELNEWTRLVLSAAHQESYWTHFRMGKDDTFRVFKGDGFHGHGILQIDDRSHKKIVESNKVYDLTSHVIYAFDVLYSMRQNAIKKPCKGGKTVEAISRSAYSAYNGGPASKCRWTNSGKKWSRNDKDFLEKYRGQLWRKKMNSTLASN